MRTTLDIEEDVLQAAKELARQLGTSAGKVLSDLARAGLTGPTAARGASVRRGIPVIASRGEVITPQKIREIMEAEGV